MHYENGMLDGVNYLEDKNGDNVCIISLSHENAKEFADFIVMACNCHADLLSAAKEVLLIIEKYSDVPAHIFALKEAIAKAEA